MTDPTTNPFVLPGMGQSSDLSGNPLLASMEMMRQAWAGLAGPGGLAQSLPTALPMNLEEFERRIADLRAVESWLRMNLSMLSSTIQGMEVQRSTIATLRSFVDKVSSMDTGAAAEPGQPTPLEIALGLKPAPKDSAAPASRDSSADAPAAKPEAAQADEPGAHEGLDNAARSASQAWWSLLQQQFNNIAAATAASMPGMPGMPGAAPGGADARASEPSQAAAPGHAATPDAPKRAAQSRSAGATAKPAKTAKKTAAKRAPTARKTATPKPPADKS